MATKDRLEELRNRSAQLNDQIDFPIRFEDHWDESDNLVQLYTPSEWAKLEGFLFDVEQIQQQITLLESYVEDAKLKHLQLQATVLMSPHEDQKTKQELDSVMAAFKQLSNNVRSSLKQIKDESENIKIERLSREEYFEHAVDVRIRSSQEAALNRRFVTVLQDYNAEQVKFKESCQSRIQSYLQLTGRTINADELDDMIESGNFEQHMNSLVLEERKVKQVLLELEARHEDILRLEANVRELHQLFLYTAMLVEQQGDLVDRIEYNVQNTVDVTQRARKKLAMATKFKYKYRRKKMCCIVSVIVAIVILIIIAVSSVCGGTSLC